MAGVINQRLIEEVKFRTNILDLIREHIQLKQKGKEHVGLCPFHDDHIPSLNVNPQKQIFKCFSCGAGGDAFKFLMMHQGLSFPQAVSLLAQKAGIELDFSEQERAQYRETKELYNVLEQAQRLYEQQLWRTQAPQEYLQSRGISKETAKEFSLGYAPSGNFILNNLVSGTEDITTLQDAGLVSKFGSPVDRFQERIMFPITDSIGRLVSFAGRTIVDNSAKYINGPETQIFRKAEILYGLSVASKTIREKQRAVVVEGYLDVVLASQNGFGEFIATCGTAFTKEQVRTMTTRFPKAEVFLFFDGDEAGRESAFEATRKLIGRGNTRVCLLEEGKDPADILVQEGAESLEEKLLAAIPHSDFYILEVAKGKDLTVPENIVVVTREISEDLRGMPSSTVEIFIEKICQSTGLSKTAIEKAVSREQYDTLGSFETKSRVYWESVLLKGLLQSPETRTHLEKRISPDIFTNPERRALFRYALETEMSYPLLHDQPLFEQTEVDKILTELEKREAGLDMQYIKTFLLPKKTEFRNFDTLEKALKQILNWDTFSAGRQAIKNGIPLSKIMEISTKYKNDLKDYA